MRLVPARGLVSAILLSSSLLAGCVGYTGGHASVPYIGQRPESPQEVTTRYALGELGSLTLPGLRLDVRLNNKTFEYQNEVAFLIPTRISRPDRVADTRDRHLSATLFLKADRGGIWFDPRLAVVTVDGRRERVSGAWLEDAERFRQAMHREFEANARAAAAVRDGSASAEDLESHRSDPMQWRDPVRAPVALEPARGGLRFVLEFDTPVPPTDASITLDLSRALSGSAAPPVPPIHFRQIRWSFAHG